MRSNAVTGNSPRRIGFRGLLSVLAIVGGAALITTGPGCGSSTSPLPNDAGSDVKTGSGGRAATGGTGAGGTTTGTGGSGMGGSSTGGSGVGGAGVGGTTDAGTDTNDPCANAIAEGGAGDMDFDGTPDCQDQCPNDPTKQMPGICGCGTVDTDSDGDGVPDCIDKCPGISDTTGSMDSDNDGVIDCKDVCPHDMSKTTSPGVCGCGGIPDNQLLCLVHRYSFNDTTTTIADSITIPGVSPKDGMGSTAAVIPSGGRLTLAGGGASSATNGQWVTLPAGMISTLGPSATFEAWVAWTPPLASAWQRIFDFGSSNAGIGTPGVGQTYLFLSPAAVTATGTVRTAITLSSNGGEDIVNGPGPLPMGASPLIHVAVVVDDVNLKLSLYVNGQPAGASADLRGHNILTSLNDVNNWLGRSQWAPDGLLGGIYEEFRIYSKALSPEQIAFNAAQGPNVVAQVTADGGTSTDGGTDAPSDASSGQ
jgi:concanavalin A-like lectin/glucanase superfamily protein